MEKASALPAGSAGSSSSSRVPARDSGIARTCRACWLVNAPPLPLVLGDTCGAAAGRRPSAPIGDLRPFAPRLRDKCHPIGVFGARAPPLARLLRSRAPLAQRRGGRAGVGSAHEAGAVGPAGAEGQSYVGGGPSRVGAPRAWLGRTSRHPCKLQAASCNGRRLLHLLLLLSLRRRRRRRRAPSDLLALVRLVGRPATG